MNSSAYSVFRVSSSVTIQITYENQKVLIYLSLMSAVMSVLELGITMLPRETKIDNSVMADSAEAASESLTVTFVCDNNSYTERLKPAWGLSCLISGTEKTILFDTGNDGSLLMENLRILGINPDIIDVVFLSHEHHDHIGGLDSLLSANHKVTVFTLKSFGKDFTKNVRGHGATVVEVQEPVKVCRAGYSTGELGSAIKEQSLIVNSDKGLIVISGCAHPGIVKIVNRAREMLEKDVLLVMGGFHLLDDEDDVKKVVSEFRELGVKHVGPCHCSGSVARSLFEKEYGDCYINIGVGKVIAMKELR